MQWRQITINSLDLLINSLNKITWKGINIKGKLSLFKYEKGTKISDY